MPNITVPGANGAVVTLRYDTESTYQVANMLAGEIASGVANGSIVPFDNKSRHLPPAVAAGKVGEYVASHPGRFVMPPGYDNVVVSAHAATILGSGGPNERILSGRANLTFVATQGSGTVAAGGGNNAVRVSGNDTAGWNIYTGNGNDIVVALNAGENTIAASGGRNVIRLGSGSNLLLTEGSDTVIAGTGTETITQTGAGPQVMLAMDSKLFFVGDSGPATILGGTGSVTVFGGSGRSFIRGGSDGDNFIQAGSGPATLFGGGQGDQLYAAGDARQVLHAGAGNETLAGIFASGKLTFYAGPGDNQIFGGTGSNTFIGGSGAATVTANPGSVDNIFRFINGRSGGTEFVDGLTSAEQVHIDLVGYTRREAAHALATQVSGMNSTTITLSDNTTVTFSNVTQLTSGNFI